MAPSDGIKQRTAMGNEALVVAFDSTASALHFAMRAKEAGLPGRLIPVPRSLSAGCGIAWRDLPENEDQAKQLVKQEAIDDAHFVVMLLR